MQNLADFFDDFNKKKIFFLLSILVAIFVFFRLLPSQTRRLHEAPDGILILGASVIDSTANGTVIVDKGNTRLLFLNRENKLVAQVNTNDLEVPFEKFYDVAVSPDGVYVTGARFLSGGASVLSEGLALYSFDGVFQRMIASDDYADLPPSNAVRSPRYQRTYWDRDRLLLYKFGSIGTEAQQIFPAENFRCISTKVPGKIVKVFPLHEKGNHLLCDDLGRCCLYDYAAASFSPISYDAAKSYMLQSLRPPTGIQEEIFSDSLFPYSQRLSHCGDSREKFYHINWKGELWLYSASDGMDRLISTVPLSTSLLIKRIAFLLATAYLAILLLGLLYFGGRYVLNSPSLRTKAGQLLLLILLSGGISAFYTETTFDLMKEQHLVNARRELQQLNFNMEKLYRPIFQELEKQGIVNYLAKPANQNELAELIGYVHGVAAVTEQHDKGYIELSLLDNYGCFYSFADTSHRKNFGDITNTRTNLQEGGFKEDEFYHEVLPNGMYSGVYHFIRGDGNNKEGSKIIGMLDVGFFETALLYDQHKFAIENFISLLAAFIALNVIYLIGHLILANISDYRKRKARQEAFACAELFPSVSFLFSLIFHVDMIVRIFIIKKLLGDAELTSLAFWLSALPAACCLGSFIGSLILPWLQRHLSSRRLAISSGAGSVLSCAFLIFSLFEESICLYLSAVFVYGLILEGILYNWFTLIPLAFEKNARSASLYANRKAYDLSTVAIVSLAAYLYEYFGCLGIYGLSFIVSLVILAIIFLFFDETLPVSETTTEKTPSVAPQGSWRFFLLPAGIAGIVFAILPQTIVGQYGGYFFPIFTAASGVSSIMISNIFVCARMFSLLLRNGVIAIKTKLGIDGTLVAGLLLFGWAHAMFFANATIVWAVIALFIITAASDSTDLANFIFDKAGKNGFDPVMAGPSFIAVSSIVTTIAPFIISAGIKYLGSCCCCVAIGLFTILSALIVWRLTETKGEKVPAEA